MTAVTARDLLRGLLGPLDGAKIPGGCDCCQAYQIVRPLVAGVWSATTHHDERCPFLAQYEAERA